MQIRVGDLVKIPLTDRVAAVGQVVIKRQGLIVLAVFPAGEFAGDEDLRSRAIGRPDLVVETMNVLIATGRWSILGSAPIVGDIPIPVYVVPVGTERTFYIQDINGNLLRPANSNEADTLRMPKSFSPAVVEDAVRAVNGLGDWLPNYDDMRADWARSAERILGSDGSE